MKKSTVARFYLSKRGVSGGGGVFGKLLLYAFHELLAKLFLLVRLGCQVKHKMKS